MIAKRLSELQRNRQAPPKKLVAAINTGLKDQLTTIGWLNSTTVGVSCEEEIVEWTTEDHQNICDNNTGKRLSPEVVEIARREELEFMDILSQSCKKLR